MKTQYLYDLIHTLHKRASRGQCPTEQMDIAVREVLASAPNLPRELDGNELLLGQTRSEKCTA